MCSGGDDPAGKVTSSTTVSIPGCAAVLDDQGVEEPPCLCLLALGGVNNCCRHFGHLLVRTRPAQVVRYPYDLRSYGNLTIMSSNSSGPGGQRPLYVGAMLGVVWQWVRVQLYAGVVAAGFDDLSAAHVALWRYPGLEGVRPSQLADRVGITKQSVNDLLGHLEGHGYLLRVPDSVDGRARAIQLTAKGRRLQETIYAAAGTAQQQIEEILGPRRFAQLHSSLELLTEQLEFSPAVP
jgi:DNA-binding MarR family transcriptional regulator